MELLLFGRDEVKHDHPEFIHVQQDDNDIQIASAELWTFVDFLKAKVKRDGKDFEFICVESKIATVFSRNCVSIWEHLHNFVLSPVP